MRPTQRHVTAGPGALAALEGLLGLKPGGGWRLDGACALGQEAPRVRLALLGGAHRLVVYLLARSAAEALVRAPGLSLSAKGPAGPAVVKLLEVFAARLGERTLAEIAAALEADPRSFTEQTAPGRDGDQVKVPCIGQPMALLEAGWRNFYADQDFEVLLGVPSCSSEKTINVEYADLECYYARPRRSFTKWTFMDWPEESENGQDGAPGGGEGEEREGSIVTELEERDMVMGTGERADALVAEVRKRAKPGDYLLFTHLCTPIVMGEDFSGLARRCEKEIGGSSVSWSQKDRDENDNFGAHFRSLLGAPGFFDGPGDPALVNLFHFPKRVREEELSPMLAALGLKVGVCVFPDVSFPALPALPEARWQVFCERSSYPTKVRDLLAASPRPVATVPAPYGVEGTRRCLRGIAAATGKAEAFDEAWAARMAAVLPRWEELRREAAGHRLAFVVSEATMPRLLALRYGHGAPLATMVLEMGFGVDLVYYDRHGEPPALPPALKDARLAVFRSPWELERALREGDFSAVYSDIVFDRRITRAGKARFASKDFEMGVEGALRTFEKLLPVCRLPFYRQYSGHLRGRHDG